ncbi:MAG: PA4642 family protein [Pseudomonadales bacterium]|nr:PA4642 family protein [Pseudomonadales bacterium]
MAGPSQPQVTDEVWDDDRVKSFLDLEPHGENADFHVLLKAYRGMRVEDFDRFLVFFTDAGRNLDAKDLHGRTLWSIIENHRQGADFIVLRKKYN